MENQVKNDNREQKICVGNMQFQKDFAVDVFGIGDIFYNGYLKDLDYEIIIRKINDKVVHPSLTENDLLITKIFKKISYVLKIHAHVREDSKTYIGYEYYQYTLRKRIELNDGNINDQKFKKLIKDLFKGIKFFHDENHVINNISADNVAICMEDKEEKSKIFNLTMAKINSDCTKDINDIPLLLLSLMNTFNKSPLECAIEIKTQSSLLLKIKFICNIIKQQGWIEQKNIRLLAHLIVCLIEAKNCDNTVIAIFLKHPYFWEKAEICKFIELVNLRNPTEKKNGKTKFLGEFTHSLNEILKKYETWQNDLNEEVEKTLRTGYLKVVSELIRLMRNKETHLLEERKELQDFCLTYDGFINYFLNKNPDLLYDLFMYHWRYRESDPNLLNYYPIYIISEDTNDIFDDSDKIATSSEDNNVTLIPKPSTSEDSSSKSSLSSHRGMWPPSAPAESSLRRNKNIWSQNKHEAFRK